MFTGDAAGGSGEWVARALHAHGFATQPTSHDRGDGFRLVDAYITAALHCVPPDNRPRPAELRRCAGYLREELGRLRSVRIVVAYLGAATGLGWRVPRPRPRFAHGAALDLPWGVTLLATYHPSRQNTQTRRLTWPMFDAVFAEARRRLGLPGGQPEAGRPVRASESPRTTRGPAGDREDRQGLSEPHGAEESPDERLDVQIDRRARDGDALERPVPDEVRSTTSAGDTLASGRRQR
jgi:uracil-DNA glycosylase